ncbi:LytR/AlgR family response regulator transcription factor [Polluticaenibacter yanchengensis]|uniref:LytTR family DNA-binding domain-containing protein n=1 Tax=Polluticaenibacter yanchengensis TaxID=3014562 RepID=A0ABT4UGB3_9BACT|nr:LytTR family DNA-binding domain-containing protein [Chitinophagaceae bacterium LY-5]
MTTQTTPYQFFSSKTALKYIIPAGLAFFIIATVIQDYTQTYLQNSAFYISESLLFSSYWLLFLPLLVLLLKFSKEKKSTTVKLSFTLLAILVHLITYPALVWALSKAFYYHTFAYWQTFTFGLSAYFIKTIIIYGFSIPAYILWQHKYRPAIVEEETGKQTHIDYIYISDNANRKTVLETKDILYFSASSPYINVYHLSKKYLYTETLRSLEASLNDRQFVRIHKSHIVNLSKIISIQSRQNGDYDVTLSDGTVLRVSRNYAKNFKLKFAEQYRLTSK